MIRPASQSATWNAITRDCRANSNCAIRRAIRSDSGSVSNFARTCAVRRASGVPLGVLIETVAITCIKTVADIVTRTVMDNVLYTARLVSNAVFTAVITAGISILVLISSGPMLHMRAAVARVKRVV